MTVLSYFITHYLPTALTEPLCGRRSELLGVGPKLIGVVGAEGMVHTSPVTRL